MTKTTKPRLRLGMMGVVYVHLIDTEETGAGMWRHTTQYMGRGFYCYSWILL